MAEQFFQNSKSKCVMSHNCYMPKSNKFKMCYSHLTCLLLNLEMTNHFPKFQMGHEKRKHQSKSVKKVGGTSKTTK